MNDPARSPSSRPLPTVRDLLRRAEARGLPRSEARRLMAHVLGREPGWVLARDDEGVPDGAAGRFDALADRRLDAVPMAYLTGVRDFHRLRLQVDARVLDPRPDTEILVEWALEWLGRWQAPVPPSVLDLGTGSGAIALALARACPAARVTAVDRSPAALAVAEANGASLGLAVRWLHGDWLTAWRSLRGEPVVGERFDLIVSNPPYIADADPHLGALRHEPRDALVSGADGLNDLRHLAARAPAHLRPGGALLLEHGHQQGRAVQALLDRAGGARLGARYDLAGHWRCTGAAWAAPVPSEDPS